MLMGQCNTLLKPAEIVIVQQQIWSKTKVTTAQYKNFYYVGLFFISYKKSYWKNT